MLISARTPFSTTWRSQSSEPFLPLWFTYGVLSIGESLGVTERPPIASPSEELWSHSHQRRELLSSWISKEFLGMKVGSGGIGKGDKNNRFRVGQQFLGRGSDSVSLHPFPGPSSWGAVNLLPGLLLRATEWLASWYSSALKNLFFGSNIYEVIARGAENEVSL